MILTIPYHPLLPGYEKLVSAINRYGKHPAHSLAVVSLPQHEDAALELAMKVKDQFGRYFAVTIPQPQQPESPLRASNRMFLAALDNLRAYQPAGQEHPEPVMLYFDPLWRPTRARWLDEFHADYHLAGAPITFGNFVKDGAKARVEGPVAINARFLKITKLLDFMNGEDHWRDFLAWEIINHGLQAEAFGKILPAYIRPFDP